MAEAADAFMNMKARIEYTETNEQGLDLVRPMWQKLIEHHKTHSPKYFRRRYTRITFDLRKKQLLEKSKKGGLRIDIAQDTNTKELVGYCISTINRDRQGEIESIYIEPDYRGSCISDNLMKRALRWMDEYSVTKKILEVGAGNEEVFTFYKRYNFYPRTTIMEQVETREADK